MPKASIDFIVNVSCIPYNELSMRDQFYANMQVSHNNKNHSHDIFYVRVHVNCNFSPNA